MIDRSAPLLDFGRGSDNGLSRPGWVFLESKHNRTPGQPGCGGHACPGVSRPRPTASATSSILLLMLGDSFVFSRIASAMASRRTPIAASLSTPRRSQKKALTEIRGMLTVGRIHLSS